MAWDGCVIGAGRGRIKFCPAHNGIEMQRRVSSKDALRRDWPAAHRGGAGSMGVAASLVLGVFPALVPAQTKGIKRQAV